MCNKIYRLASDETVKIPSLCEVRGLGVEDTPEGTRGGTDA